MASTMAFNPAGISSTVFREGFDLRSSALAISADPGKLSQIAGTQGVASYAQGDTAYQPAYSSTGWDGVLPAMTFDATDDHLDLSADIHSAVDAWDVVFVAQFAATGSAVQFLAAWRDNNLRSAALSLGVNSSGNLYINHYGGGGNMNSATNPGADKHVLHFSGKNGSAKIRMDGVEVYSVASGDWTHALGGTGYGRCLGAGWNGLSNSNAKIPLMWCFQGADIMSDADAANVAAALKSEWGTL